jgi:hypothetical protein
MAGDRPGRDLAQKRLVGEPSPLATLTPTDAPQAPPLPEPGSPRSKLDGRLEHWFTERDRFDASRKKPPLANT